MMSKRFTSVFLVLAAAGAISFAAACSSSSSGSAGTPTPTPTPFTDCFFLWQGPALAHPTDQNYADEAIVDIPVASWSGTQNLTYDLTNNAGLFFIDVNFGANPVTQDIAAIATAGAFGITVGAGGTDANTSVSFTDTDIQNYFDGSGTTVGALLGSGGLGSFTGVVSPAPLSASTAVPGTGDISVKLSGSNYSIGSSSNGVTVVGCEVTGPFAPVSPADRAIELGKIMHNYRLTH